MLESLEIRDFALVENIRIDWTSGFNILTGETGAGKSIIIDALNAVLGGKAGASLIRTGCEKSFLEASFKLTSSVIAWLKQQELIDEDLSALIVSREISKTGSKVRINGTLVNHAIAQELGQILLTIHAQHEARTLMSSNAQLEMLDRLGDQAHRKLLDKVRLFWMRRKEILGKIKELDTSEEERLRRLDFIRFQNSELEEARLGDVNEDEELVKQQRVLANVAQLAGSATRAYELLIDGEQGADSSSSAVDQLQSALAELEKGLRLDSELTEPCDLLRHSLASMEECARNLRRYSANLETDPEALSTVETRLAALAAIKRKYGPTLADAIAQREKLLQEQDKLEHAQSTTDQLNSELAEVSETLNSASLELSAKRKKLGNKLSEAVQVELSDLGMERCRFEIKFDSSDEVMSMGCDRVDFLIAPNPGQPLMPLAKIASGGELSRIMLAVKTIFAAADEVSTVIFDEIDTGLSGKVLQSMRDKLARLAKSHQILCITHQPIIASIADNHIEVEKLQTKDQTKVFVRSLDEEQRLRSLAAMASGEAEGEMALNFARSLVEQANQLRI